MLHGYGPIVLAIVIVARIALQRGPRVVPLALPRVRRRRAAPARSAGRRSALELVAHQARYEVRALLRNRQARYATLLLPVLLLVLLVGVFGDRTVDHAPASSFYVPGLAALAVISASFANLVVSVVAQREAGVLRRRRATPAPARALIAGRASASAAVSMAVIAVLVILGRVAFGVAVGIEAIPALALTALVGSLCFCSLGYALTTAIRSADTAQPAIQALMLPLCLASGVFIPSGDLPATVHGIAAVLPAAPLVDALHRSFEPTAGLGIAWYDLAVLGLWTVAGLAVALRRFRWAPSAVAA